MFRRSTSGCVQVMNRWLSDPLLFAIILTIVVFIATMIGTQQGPLELVWFWGGQDEAKDGFWSLPSFAMQVALVLVLDSVMISAKAYKKVLAAIAILAHDKKSAVLVITSVSTICCWLNWGFGLIAGTLLAKVMVRRVRDVSYLLLTAFVYSGFIIWHTGLSGSTPLQIGGTGSGVLGVVCQAPVTATIFRLVSLVMILVILVFMPFADYAVRLDTGHAIVVDPALLVDEVEKTYTMNIPTEKIECNKVLWFITLVLGFAYTICYFVQKGFNLDLNTVGTAFLFLGILLHGDPCRYVDAIAGTISGAADIPPQFSFYAGIIGLMVAQNDAGMSLVGVVANFFTQISDNVTFSVLTSLSVGIVSFFVPSSNRQQVVQAPIVMSAATEIGIEYGRAATTIAWGGQQINTIQPFWTLSALGTTGLSAHNIMGYLTIITILTGLVTCGGFLLWGPPFQVLNFMRTGGIMKLYKGLSA